MRADGVYALATNLPERLSATKVLRLYKDQQIVERRHRDLKLTLRVGPIVLRNRRPRPRAGLDRRIALLAFGLSGSPATKPTGRNVLAAFQGLDLTYAPQGSVLDA